MKLKVLSLREALEYVPEKGDYGIRILNSRGGYRFRSFPEHENWVGVNRYFFDDVWPWRWDEYCWSNPRDSADALRRLHYKGRFRELRKGSPLMTWKSFSSYLEHKGTPWGRDILFNQIIGDIKPIGDAEAIMRDFERVKNEVGRVVVHCTEGIYRGTGVGVAMNEIYDWGIKGLKEKHFRYRRFVYSEMMRVARDRFK